MDAEAEEEQGIDNVLCILESCNNKHNRRL